MLLSTAELAMMRADVANMLPDSVVIEAVTVTTVNGRTSETWAAVTGGTVAARIDPLNNNQQPLLAGGAEPFKLIYRLTVPWDAPLEVGCRVQHDGNAYEVRQLFDTHSWRVSVRAAIARIE